MSVRTTGYVRGLGSAGRGSGRQSHAPRRWRGGAMGTSRPTAKPHEGERTTGARGARGGNERGRRAKPRTAPMARRRDEDIAPYRNGTRAWGRGEGARRRGAGRGAAMGVARGGGGLVGFEPVCADTDFGFQGDGKFHGVFHGIAYEFGDGIRFGFWDIQEEFVVDLQEEFSGKVMGPEFVCHAHHCELDEIGGGALDGGIDCVAFGAGADGAVSRGDIAQWAAATENGCDVTV